MKDKTLQFQTVKPILRSSLEHLMMLEEFTPFRLVGEHRFPYVMVIECRTI